MRVWGSRRVEAYLLCCCVNIFIYMNFQWTLFGCCHAESAVLVIFRFNLANLESRQRVGCLIELDATVRKSKTGIKKALGR